MNLWQQDRIGSALAGCNPTVMTRLQASFAVFGDLQFLPGYCVVLVDRVGVDRLSELPRGERMTFLADVELVADAVERVCSARDTQFRRVNIEILGNTDAFLHAHIWPRYEWESAERVSKPVWLYPAERWTTSGEATSSQHVELRDALTTQIRTLATETPETRS